MSKIDSLIQIHSFNHSLILHFKQVAYLNKSESQSLSNTSCHTKKTLALKIW